MFISTSSCKISETAVAFQTMPTSQKHNERTPDCLRPSCEQSSNILKRSWHHWQGLLQSAARLEKYPAPCFDIQLLLNQTPSIPSHAEIKETIGDNLCLEGTSQWDIGHRRDCCLECTTKSSRLQSVLVGSLEPNFCTFSKATTLIWPNKLRNSSTSLNYLAMFVLGWSYVFSARLVVLRRNSSADHILYTGSRAPVRRKPRETKDDSTISVRLGDLDAVELRWWAAILAPGCGWQAVLFRSDHRFYPPWSCHLSQDIRFEILHPDRTIDADHCPPTSGEAQQYLNAFAKANNVYDQLQAALAACLTLPPQGRFGAPIELPHPRAACSQCITPTSIRQWPEESHIPHYMALSCIPNAVSSSMFSCLWEPGIECHLASEWLCPVQSLVQLLREEERPHTIVKMMALHRPSSAPLWLGAAITGLVPKLLSIGNGHMTPISLEATV